MKLTMVEILEIELTINNTILAQLVVFQTKNKVISISNQTPQTVSSYVF